MEGESLECTGKMDFDIPTPRDISSRSKCADECLKEKRTQTGITNVNYQDNYDETTQTKFNEKNTEKYSCYCIAAYAGQIYSSISMPKYHDTCVLKTTGV